MTTHAGVIGHLVNPFDGRLLLFLLFLLFLEKLILKLHKGHVVLELFLELGEGDVILVRFNLRNWTAEVWHATKLVLLGLGRDDLDFSVGT